MPIDDQNILAEKFSLIETIPTLGRHKERIFLPLGEMIDAYVSSRDKISSDTLRLFDTIKTNYSSDTYTAIQRQHLSIESLQTLARANIMSPEHKYLDLPFWLNGKIGAARAIGLSRRSGQRILDIGSGPGHFGVVARFYGCDYVGLECKLSDGVVPGVRHLYNDLCEYFKIERIEQNITARVPIVVTGRFDVLTVLMGTFSAYQHNSNTTTFDSTFAWTWIDWAFFLDDVISNVMKEGDFEIYMQIGREFYSNISADIKKYAYFVDDDRCVFRINQNVDREQLRRDSMSAQP